MTRARGVVMALGLTFGGCQQCEDQVAPAMTSVPFAIGDGAELLVAWNVITPTSAARQGMIGIAAEGIGLTSEAIELPGEVMAVSTGTRSRLVVVSTSTAATAVVLAAGALDGAGVPLPTEAVRAAAAFDGTGYQLVWIDAERILHALHVSEDRASSGELEIGTLTGNLPDLATIDVLPFGAGGTAVVVLDAELYDPSHVFTAFFSRGAPVSTPAPFLLPVADRTCTGGTQSALRGSLVRNDSAGAPILRMFACGPDPAAPGIVLELAPGMSAPRTAPLALTGAPADFYITGVLGRAPDRTIVVGTVNPPFVLHDDDSLEVFPYVGAAPMLTPWVPRGSGWIFGTYGSDGDSDRAMMLRTVGPDGSATSTSLVQDTGEYHYESCRAPT